MPPLIAALPFRYLRRQRLLMSFMLTLPPLMPPLMLMPLLIRYAACYATLFRRHAAAFRQADAFRFISPITRLCC